MKFIFISLTCLSFCFLAHAKNPETAVIWNPIAEKHNLEGHPESAIRLKYTMKKLQDQNLLKSVTLLEARSATEKELLLAHSKHYIEYVKNWSKTQSSPYLSPKKWAPYNTPKAYEAASTAAGGLIQLTEAVAQKKYQNGFALIRPPGHHALKDRGMGYCIFNNISIATLNLLNKKLAKKILIVDIDAHHGNGIEDILKNRSDVLYLSFHQQLMFPYTGDKNTANSKNFPLKFLTLEEDYKNLFKKNVTDAFKSFSPDFVIVSAGYDAHWRDYMSNLGLSSMGHAWLAQELINEAKSYAEGRIVFSLEGGYDLEALANGVSNTIKALTGQSNFIDTIGPMPSN